MKTLRQLHLKRKVSQDVSIINTHIAKPNAIQFIWNVINDCDVIYYFYPSLTLQKKQFKKQVYSRSILPWTKCIFYTYNNNSINKCLRTVTLLTRWCSNTFENPSWAPTRQSWFWWAIQFCQVTSRSYSITKYHLLSYVTSRPWAACNITSLWKQLHVHWIIPRL